MKKLLVAVLLATALQHTYVHCSDANHQARIAFVSAICDKRCSPEQRTLHDAVSKLHVRQVFQLLKEGVPVGIGPDETALYPLATIIDVHKKKKTQRNRARHIRKIGALLIAHVQKELNVHGCSLANSEKLGWPIGPKTLETAITHGCVPLIPLLVQAGVQIHPVQGERSSCWDPLFIASRRPEYVMCENQSDIDDGHADRMYLCDYYPDIQTPTDLGERTMFALLDAGIDVGARDQDGHGALWHALSASSPLGGGNYSAARALFIAGAPLEDSEAHLLVNTPALSHFRNFALACQQLHGHTTLATCAGPEQLTQLQPEIDKQKAALLHNSHYRQFFTKQ